MSVSMTSLNQQQKSRFAAVNFSSFANQPDTYKIFVLNWIVILFFSLVLLRFIHGFCRLSVRQGRV